MIPMTGFGLPWILCYATGAKQHHRKWGSPCPTPATVSLGQSLITEKAMLKLLSIYTYNNYDLQNSLLVQLSRNVSWHKSSDQLTEVIWKAKDTGETTCRFRAGSSPSPKLDHDPKEERSLNPPFGKRSFKVSSVTNIEFSTESY